MSARSALFALTAAAAAALALGGCKDDHGGHANHQHGAAPSPAATPAAAPATAAAIEPAAGVRTAVAELKPAQAATTRPTMNNVGGTVTFTQPAAGGPVTVTAVVTGLPPNSTHGFHIHEKGDLSAPDLMSTGGHFNPWGHDHGAPGQSPSHAGDFGNLQSDATGTARLQLSTDAITLGGGAKNDVVGKALIVHDKADDLKSQPTGNAGGRVAGGVIEMKK